MANIPLKSIKFPDLEDTYTVPSNAGELPYNKSATYPDDTVGKALQDKPDADGTIANAEQLTSNIYEEDSVPYNFRTSGGSIDIGDRETDTLVGGTVAWNQLVKATDIASKTDAGITGVNNGDGSYTCTGTATGGFDAYKQTAFLVVGHKYLVTGCPSGGSDDTYYVYFHGFKDIGGGRIVNATGPSNSIDVCIKSGYAISGSLVFRPQLFDLTQMFGTTIADYIYNLEQATAGAGVAWFRKLFPKPYYAYNAGELMSVQASSHDMVGFNQWDEVTQAGYWNTSTGNYVSSSGQLCSKNYIPVLPNTTYYYYKGGGTTNGEVLAYGATKNYLSSLGQRGNQTFTTPSDCYFIQFNVGSTYGATYNNDICINLSWDGERDGEYEAYVKHSYALDSSLTLRGIPKLDANGNLYYDGDTYESDGTVTRKYGVVDLGTLTWSYNSTYAFFYAFMSDRKAGSDNLLCKYPYGGYKSDSSMATATDKTIYRDASNSTAIKIKDTAYTDAATFKTAMSGAYLVYELATPTTETADAYTNPQIVNDFGTEEYVDYAASQGDRDVSIPVGHYTQYMANLKAKLEMSPNSPEGAGDYIVRQTNGENEYVSLASNATIQDIIARLEALENAES